MNTDDRLSDRHRHPRAPRGRLWARVVLTALCAAMAFGGTFTCRGDNNSHTFTDAPTTGAD